MNQQNLDQAWAEAAQQGDRQAFTQLANKYTPLLIQFLLPYTRILEDAEDLCQESLQRAYDHLSQYDSRYAFSTWLFNIARHAAIDHYRKTNSAPPLVSQSPVTMENDANTQSESPEETYIRHQTRQNIRTAIQAMPERYREAAELRFLKEYAYEEIAHQLNLPLNTVRTRIRRARELLLQSINHPNAPKL